MTTRIYAVQGRQDREFHLVEASTKGAALRHVASRIYGVAVADQRTLVAAIQDGIPVEKAGAEQAEAE